MTKKRNPIFTLNHNIVVLAEYEITKTNRYKRLRIIAHDLFDAVVVCGTMTIRKSRAVMTSELGRKLLADEQVHHKNEDRSDDSPENLELISSDEHNKHHKSGVVHSEQTKARIGSSLCKAYFEGRKISSPNFGINNASAKLNPDLVRSIRSSNESANSLAKKLGVSKPAILAARNRKTWRDIV